MDANMLLNLAIDAGEIMLSSGAETSRVEDTMERIMSVGGNKMPEAFVITTGVLASTNGYLTGTVTKFKRVCSRSINLEKITMINSLSRDFVEGNLTIEEAFVVIEEIQAITPFKNATTIASYGIACSGLSLMMYFHPLDAFLAFISGVILGILITFFRTREISSFLVTIFGSALICVMAIVFGYFGFAQNYQHIIISGLVPLVPGVATTNAVRDTMGGDFLSGTARLVEAVAIAAAIAIGVGVTLQLFSAMFGGA